MAANPFQPALDSGEDRRDDEARQELQRRIQVEYAEMPGMRLTLRQAGRLFALREDICERVLNELVAARYLRRDSHGGYARSLSL